MNIGTELKKKKIITLKLKGQEMSTVGNKLLSIGKEKYNSGYDAIIDQIQKEFIVLPKKENVTFVVSVIYKNNIEKVFVYTDKDVARKKRLALCKEWCNKDSVEKWLAKGNTLDNLDNYCDYFMEVEDDAYVQLNEVVLEDEQTTELEDFEEKAYSQVVLTIPAGSVPLEDALNGNKIQVTGVPTCIIYGENGVDEKLLDSDVLEHMIDEGFISDDWYREAKESLKLANS